MIKGIIINKFRGDIELLGSGPDDIERLTDVPVLGVLPYRRLRIPSEDSVSIGDKNKHEAALRVAVVRLPRISNFTDFEPLEEVPGVLVEYVDVDEPHALDGADIIILPGTKNTIGDLRELKSHGMDDKLISMSAEGVPVIGICGGYQMLGAEIVDNGVENTWTEKGLGLLPIVTTFEKYEKDTRQVTKRVTGSSPILDSIRGDIITGYEIHMGRSRVTASGHTEMLIPFEDDGFMSDNGLVIGTYLHGLFGNVNMRKAVIRYLTRNKAEPDIKHDPKQAQLREAHKELGCRADADPFDELADMLREHIDLGRIYKLLGL